MRELQILLAMVSQPEQAAELSRALGIIYKAPGTNVVSSIVKIERSESSLARNEATLSPRNKYLQNERIVSLPSIVKTEGPKYFGARSVATISSPNNAEGPESLLARNEATPSLPNKYLQNERIVSLPSIAKTGGPKSFGARFAVTLSSPNNAEGPESSLTRIAATLSSPNNALHFYRKICWSLLNHHQTLQNLCWIRRKGLLRITGEMEMLVPKKRLYLVTLLY
ncbi:hypothetical protein RchiOBHm_Chr2g0124191 [Rosa chinensis]|uniref:Uncharacterized protein n=1 Tax=Rosa chinensis TaxID=74649 RepID=A0A2P6RTA7_ROSCH|nr:hypothetical protein RchiOBHm_Chr2g0124191 [Rosa chinensis]